ncbi:methylmalonyl-CoA epimerase, mitochondrial-like [Oppia nitens]|uniref:methylmalonyl-CoA epimerase, mitochondrial-like n=1 Tax=Oppia nitens TaxID=1686743 RepID=UPI0023D9C8DC|nr:methylmalonyl-CoA epimerase, mitochondrial-like [Oppia nitens]
MSSLLPLFRNSHKLKHLLVKNYCIIGVKQLSQRTGRPWKVLGLNHIAIATNDVNNGSQLYRDVFKLNTSDTNVLPEHGVNTVFVNLNNTKVELLDPIGGQNSPIWSFLQKNTSGGIHHICLEVDDIYAAIDDLKAKGIRILSDSPKTGAHGKDVVFLHPKDCNGVLIELEQK